MTLDEARARLLDAQEALALAFSQPVVFGGRRPGEMSPRQAARYRLAEATKAYEDAVLAAAYTAAIGAARDNAKF